MPKQWQQPNLNTDHGIAAVNTSGVSMATPQPLPPLPPPRPPQPLECLRLAMASRRRPQLIQLHLNVMQSTLEAFQVLTVGEQQPVPRYKNTC